MSKESYIRGFCKVAEAHGVDPYDLAKFAAEQTGPLYKTDGWTPKGIEHGKIPRAYSGTKYYGDVQDSYISNLRDYHYRKQNGLLPGGKKLQWLKANLEAWKRTRDSIFAPVREIKDPAMRNAINGEYAPTFLNELYRQNMQSLTGMPTRVSAPVKK